MRNYPIWFDINSCAYAKNSGAKTGNKSFGVIQHNTQNINVGFSAVNSHFFGSLDISVQDDPENMGAWRFLRIKMGEKIFGRYPFGGISRPEAASPATGSASSHRLEQARLLSRALELEEPSI